MIVLVTGGNGLVGRSLQKVASTHNTSNHKFIFLSRVDGDLRVISDVDHIFNLYSPDVVIHLASCVGGVYDNINNNYTYLIDNLRINTNIVDACRKFKVSRLINCLSTCVFPKSGITYPLTSDQLHNGLPHESNIGYAYSKRILHLASSLLEVESDTSVVNLTPTNLYGEYDNYNVSSSHVIPGLIHKTYIAKQNDKKLVVYGTGRALRQFLYVDDLSRVILRFIDLDCKGVSCIVSPPEDSEISIKNVVEIIKDEFDFSGEVVFDKSYSDGQYKKTASSFELKKYLPDFEFTDLKSGLRSTIRYFNTNFQNLRI